MPELPEVETIRIGLSKNIVGKSIKDIDIVWKGSVKSETNAFAKVVKGNKIKSIDRIGKLLIFALSRPEKYILVHLKMTGQLVYIKKKRIVAGGHKLDNHDLMLPNRHTRLVLEFSDSSKLFFSDLRKFGYWSLVDKKEKDIIKFRFGIEPIDSRFTLFNFKNILFGKKTSIKALLLNQKYISGIGNIYADEICFRSGVLPSRKVDSLDLSEIKKIYNACKYILQIAISHGGTTFRDYLDHTGQKGNFAKYLQVYGRQGRVCKKCGNKIEKDKVASRGTHFCRHCQK